jgi:indole-3-glycerol phosphate synthase
MQSLEKRVSSTRREVERRRSAQPLAQLEQAVASLAPIRPFTESVAGEEISFVVRLKAAESAVCDLAESAEVDGLAAAHDALSGLASMTQLPLLLTDMIVDRYQLFEARLFGAGGVILIAAAFDDEHDQLGDLYGLAGDLGLDVIVEVASEQEIEEVLDLLDPDSFLIRNHERGGAIDLERTFSLLEEVPAGKVVLALGGMRTREEVAALERAGVDALILERWALESGLRETLDVLRGDTR